MPIYAYKCNACGFAKDVLQKISDPVLSDCPSCHQPAFSKQVTAAGFQLKGSGWYVTDFKGNGSSTSTSPSTSTADSPASAPESSAATPSAAAASSCGGACACHS